MVSTLSYYDKTVQGVDMLFPPAADINGDMAIVDDNENIKQQIFLLLFTRKGEMLYFLTYGIGLQEKIHRSSVDTVSLAAIIKDEIMMQEYRVKTIDVNMQRLKTADGDILRTNVSFLPLEYKHRQNLVIDYNYSGGISIAEG